MKLDIWKCDGGSNQKFQQWITTVPGMYMLKLEDNPSKCLADPWDSAQNGTKLEVWTCGEEFGFLWMPAASVWSSTAVGFLNINGLVFGNENGVAKDGNPVIMWHDFGGFDQSWFYRAVLGAGLPMLDQRSLSACNAAGGRAWDDRPISPRWNSCR